MSRTTRKVKYARWLRHPKTFPEHRDEEACRVDGIKKRAARDKRRLPSAWDDKQIAALYEIIPEKP